MLLLFILLLLLSLLPSPPLQQLQEPVPTAAWLGECARRRAPGRRKGGRWRGEEEEEEEEKSFQPQEGLCVCPPSFPFPSSHPPTSSSLGWRRSDGSLTWNDMILPPWRAGEGVSHLQDRPTCRLQAFLPAAPQALQPPPGNVNPPELSPKEVIRGDPQRSTSKQAGRQPSLPSFLASRI